MDKADHKEIGRKLGFFSFSRKVPGTAYFRPKGALLFDLIVEDLKKSLEKQGYQDLITPTIISLDTLKASGHYDNYREKLFFVGNEKEKNEKEMHWCLKPMNCPGAIMIFNEEMRSYKDLPIKFSEVGTVYRYEQPGEINGLFRARILTIDDAHIFCHQDQIEPEIIELIDFIDKTYKRYGFKGTRVELSTRPKKSIGTDEQWQKAENGLKKALKDSKLSYKENKGEGAFYGPKIDFHIKDSLGRSWQLGTIQLDFSTAERLNASYIDKDGNKKPPVIIHRAVLGSVERFIAILLEHTQGVLPFWLSPVQVYILPIASRHLKYAQKVGDRIRESGFRVEIDERNETLDKKIRDAEILKIPYVLVVGDKEEKDQSVTIRTCGKKGLKKQKVESFIKETQKLVQ